MFLLSRNRQALVNLHREVTYCGGLKFIDSDVELTTELEHLINRALCVRCVVADLLIADP